MTHRSDNCIPLRKNHLHLKNSAELLSLAEGFADVCMIILPSHTDSKSYSSFFGEIRDGITKASRALGEGATLITLGDPIDLVHMHAAIETVRFQLWINIKREQIRVDPLNKSLPEHHFGALVHTKYSKSLDHVTTRIEYSYCPVCDKTTKDYGGKKHTYNSYGTLMSDVWRDIYCDLEGDLSDVISRFADLFGMEEYGELRVLDCRSLWSSIRQISEKKNVPYEAQPSLLTGVQVTSADGKLLHGDSIEKLRTLDDNSVDFAFIDPPYNLGKNYQNYSDDLSVQSYFEWCDEWIREVARVLRPGRTVAILNIPLWAIRHFLFMEQILTFQNWIAWDALSFPVRKIMPAHYAIVCFSKGQPRPLPGLEGEFGSFDVLNSSASFQPLQPLAESFCLRASCVQKRNTATISDRGPLTDLWWDIHRLKHNSRRVDHPCQLPPQLLYRLISIFTHSGESVLDCFNGAGTTTLCAHQMNRSYIGIELSEKYFKIAQSRHKEIRQGIDPFRKVDRKLTEKNSRVPRREKQIYEVPKKTLQLEVRRVAQHLDRLPSREDMIEHGKYPIQYYDEYFASWGEVCAAARHDGMTETRENGAAQKIESIREEQQLSLFDKGLVDAKR
ncbi:MAG: DNA methyltransferase [Caldilineaceae bacterium]